MKEFDTVDELYEIIKYAKQNKLSLSISSAKNSDTIARASAYPNTLSIQNNMTKIINVNLQENYIIVESGISWIAILEELDKYKYTLYTTQSGLNFSVAGSFCGNAHGRKTQFPMVKDTILEFTFIDGESNIHTVDQYTDIFNAFPGSLGLLGIIITMKIRICPAYAVSSEQTILPMTEKTVDYLSSLSQDSNVCMMNMQFSYYKDIPEVILVEHRYANAAIEDSYKKELYTKDTRFFFTVGIIILYVLSIFQYFDSTRWSIEKHISQQAIIDKSININNSFDNWSRPYMPSFRIIEFFFPKAHFLYCQKVCMELFTKHGMTPLSSGTRIIYEQAKYSGFMRFSHAASRQNPYYSLVIDYLVNDDIHKLVDDLRAHIIKKNIHMTYHTTYEFPWSTDDIIFMFPNIQDFKVIKQRYDPTNLFNNTFSEIYINNII